MVTAINVDVYLGIPKDSTEKITNGGFENTTGSGYYETPDNWTVTTASGTNIVSNGGFESLDGADDFTDWFDVNGTIEDETTIVYSGSHALKAPEWNAQALQSFGNKENKLLTGKAYVKGYPYFALGGSVGSSNPGDFLYLNETSLQSEETPQYYAADWTERRVYKNYISESAAVLLSTNTDDVAYFDNVEILEEASHIILGPTNYYWEEDYADDYVYAGSKSLGLLSAFTNPASVSQTVNVTTGNRNHLSFWSRVPSSDAEEGIKYEIYDVTNSKTIYTGYSYYQDEWKRNSYYYTVPSGCSQIRITFTGEAGILGFIDNVSLESFGSVGWEKTNDILSSPVPHWEYGISGNGPNDFLATTGLAFLMFDNREGKYSPERETRITGFEEGMPVLIQTTISGLATSEMFTYRDFNTVTLSGWSENYDFEV